VNFDGVHAVSVTVPGTYREKLTGLCGDCNGKRDDMKTSTGRDVSRERLRYSLIGNSYQVKDDTGDVGEKYVFFMGCARFFLQTSFFFLKDISKHVCINKFCYT
jgi:hypothetical protein